MFRRRSTVLSLALASVWFLPLANAAQTRFVSRTDGVVERIRIDAHGRASGVFLRDHTEIVTPATQSDTVFANVRVGDTVRIAFHGGSPVLLLARSNRVIPLEPEPRRDASEVPVRATAVRFDDARPLPNLAVSGSVAFLTHSPTGRLTGFVMADGAQVHVIPRAAPVLAKIRPGDRLRVDGRGVHGAYGPGLWAVSITRPDRIVVLDLSRGPGAPELAFGR